MTQNMKNGQQALVGGVDEWYTIFSIQTLFERETLFFERKQVQEMSSSSQPPVVTSPVGQRPPLL